MKKKSTISIFRTTLYTQKLNFVCEIFFFKKYLFEYENQFAVKKNTKKFLGAEKKYWKIRHQKNASHTFSIYGSGMISIFFDKSFFSHT